MSWNASAPRLSGNTWSYCGSDTGASSWFILGILGVLGGVKGTDNVGWNVSLACAMTHVHFVAMTSRAERTVWQIMASVPPVPHTRCNFPNQQTVACAVTT